MIAYTPFAHVWFKIISGLSEELAQFCLVPTRILTIMPVLTVILSIQRAVLVNGKHTSPVTFATIIEVAGILTILIFSIHYLNAIGAIAAAGALVLGRLMANGFLISEVKKVLKTSSSK